MAVKFKKKIMLKKAATTAVTFLGLFVAGVASVQIPDDPAALDAALPGIGIAIAGAAWRAYRNMKKNPDKYGNPLGGTHTPSGYMWPVLAAFAVAGVLAGCVTTTAEDGTVTTQIDGALLETMLTRYDRYMERRELLEIERERARRADDAVMMAIAQAELDKLEPEITRLAERLGVLAPE